LALAEEPSNSRQRLTLIGMAQSWLLLAEQAEKNSHANLVYETPPRRDPPAAQ
jgi:hypothetical protein